MDHDKLTPVDSYSVGKDVKIHRVLLIILVFMVPVTAFADDDPETPWPIEERCLPDPVLPESNWAFDGEILMAGWAGIHAVSADFDTPYVIHWGYGAISPDGQWVLDQEVDSWHEQLSGPGPLGRTYWRFGDIIATNTVTDEVIRFQWEANITMSSRPRLTLPAGPIWIDRHRFASFYGMWAGDTKIGDTQNGEITSWEGIRFEDSELSLSPDLTRSVSFGRLYNLSDHNLVQEDLVGTDWDGIASVWAPDSSLFADVVTDRSTGAVALTIFDKDGNVVAVPLGTVDGRVNPMQWSSDNVYLSFTVSTEIQQTYIIDMHDEVIYDLCVRDTNGWAWSPDGTKFATVLGRGQSPVVVVDFDEWQPYIAAYHTGPIIMWRTVGD